MQTPPSILVIDKDKETLLEALRNANNDVQYNTLQSEDISGLKPFLRSNHTDILFLDLSCPPAHDAAQFLQSIHQQFTNLLVITSIPEGDDNLLNTALQSKVFFYIQKPFDTSEVNVALKRAFDKISINNAKDTVKKENIENDFYGIIGKSEIMVRLFDLITRVAEDDFSTVLIRGESGTGKELVAKAIHAHSKRSRNNFVPVNCAAIPDDLLESELFGHTKGAFTGAIQNKQGRIQYADGGTLFLDEIGDMKPTLQAKLLRVLQEKEFEPVGALQATPVDTRILAATHCDLEQLVKEGKFREDLYYRLSVIPLNIPPLKKRKTDIPLLLESFITKYTEKRGKEKLTFTQQVLSALINYEWRGNVRELENLVQHMSILYCGKKVEVNDLPEKFHTIDSQPGDFIEEQPVEPQSPEAISEKPQQPISTNQLRWKDGQIDFKEIINDFENQLIIQAMKRAGGNKKEAAKILGLKRTTLLEKIKKKDLNNLWKEEDR